MYTVWKLLSKICCWFWQMLNFVRECVLNLFLLLVIVGGVFIYLQVQSNQVDLNSKGALLVDLSGIIIDTLNSDDFISELGKDVLGSSDRQSKENSLFDLVATLRQAKNDSDITGIVLALDNFVGADQPSLQYIGKALLEFKSSGKPIYATGNSYGQNQYYLASFADKIYLSPQGVVNLHGIATHDLYYKTLLDKLKVSTHIFRVGTYKSAVEPYIRDNMSPEAREADQRWIDTLWNQYLTTIAANRKITQQQLYPSADTLLSLLTASHGDMAQYAKKSKLVDELASNATVEQIFSKQFGWNERDKHFNYISIYDYSEKNRTEDSYSDKNKIAVIFANGTIIDGKHAIGMVGSETTAADIRKARLDPDVKAVIFRINSPGGSVTASDMIRNELLALRQTGKPLVVSMGGMAASGGYWISTPANYIIASPSTLTGSIGIFGVINTFENTLESIGVHTDGVATSPLADVTVTKTLNAEFKQMMQLSIESGYKRFLSIVSESRSQSPAQIDTIAQGRVWSGADAKLNGLVDQLGDFDDAVKKAAELAKLKNHQLDWYESKQPSLMEPLLGKSTASVIALPIHLNRWLPEPLRQVAETLQQQPGMTKLLNDPQHRYALCLSCANVF